eukprot:TRINITY_DN2180_c0_g5_i1.p1 TRINITY_DN2180_c0_g5~~TRINITY_DN2180_c0_g5_i1.p1  ORF type:complete len:442 (+),score=77.22 TRINITY_DN2180_c0_g5_i1:176-1501(+)
MPTRPAGTDEGDKGAGEPTTDGDKGAVEPATRGSNEAEKPTTALLSPPTDEDEYVFEQSLRKSLRGHEHHQSVNLEAARSVIYLYTRVHFVGDVNLATQQFSTRFDLHVLWRPCHAKVPGFNPIIRFPESVSWREVMRIDLTDDYGGKLIGFRRTIEGTFRTPLDLHCFPFDAQVLQIEMALGRCEKTGSKLSITNGWRVAHHPAEPNIILAQFDNTYSFRPLRYYLHQSGFLEDVEKSAKYTLVIPVVRDSTYFIQNQYLFVFLVFVMNDTLPYCLEMNDTVGKQMLILTLYLLLVAYKFAIQAELPKLPYNTFFDSYIMFVFINISLTLMGIGTIAAHTPRAADHGEGDTSRADLTSAFSRGMGILAVLVHAYYIAAACIGKRTQLKIVRDTGEIDLPLVELLADAGVEVVDGVVQDMGRYDALLQAEHCPAPVRHASE